jgi:hypothetical protein
MSQHKIDLKTLKKIIKEELGTLSETIDHETVSKLVKVASQLLKSIKEFKDFSSPEALNAVTPSIAELEKTLEGIVETPGAYVSKTKSEPKKVTLTPAK